jgi:hypothetical protein
MSKRPENQVTYAFRVMEALCLEDSGSIDLGEQFWPLRFSVGAEFQGPACGESDLLGGCGGHKYGQNDGKFIRRGCSNENGDSAGRLRGCAAGCGLCFFVT